MLYLHITQILTLEEQCHDIFYTLIIKKLHLGPIWSGKNEDTVFAKNVCHTRFSNFAIGYLHENEKVRDTVFACSYGAQIESFKKNRRHLVTLTI